MKAVKTSQMSISVRLLGATSQKTAILLPCSQESVIGHCLEHMRCSPHSLTSLLRLSLILFRHLYHCLRSGIISSGCLIKILCEFFSGLPCMLHIWLIWSVFTWLPNNWWIYKLWKFSICNFYLAFLYFFPFRSEYRTYNLVLSTVLNFLKLLFFSGGVESFTPLQTCK
jgi:hypothetical protein